MAEEEDDDSDDELAHHVDFFDREPSIAEKIEVRAPHCVEIPQYHGRKLDRGNLQFSSIR